MEECEHCRHKERSDKEYRDLINRLSRIEGQIRGIKGMVEKGAYCPDILIQVSAVNAALNSFNKVLLANHIKSCVTTDIRAGKFDITRTTVEESPIPIPLIADVVTASVGHIPSVRTNVGFSLIKPL